MVRLLAYVLVGMLVLSAATSFANPEKKPHVTAPKKDLSDAQKKLNALIKSAVSHNFEDVDPDKKNEPHGVDLGKKIPPVVEMACVDEEIFSFPLSVHVPDYRALTALKNAIVTGPDEIDKHKVRLLIVAYLGLGFGDEAQDYASYLNGNEERVLNAMGRAVGGLVKDGDVALLSAQTECHIGAALWADFAKIQFGGTENIHLSKMQNEQLMALPQALAVIMTKRFGIHAVRHGDNNTSGKYLLFLENLQSSDEHPIVFDDEAKFFKALYLRKENEAHSTYILSALAQKDGMFQVHALQVLAKKQIEGGAAPYADFEEDLNGAAHVFSQHPEGKQALAQKIEFFVATDKLDQAIGMTKEKFLPSDILYTNSVLRVSERMRVYLTGDSEKRKLYALNTLLREQIFFDALADGFPLRRDGISASLDLELSELAPRILPVEQWGRLDLHVLRQLAVDLPENLKSKLPGKAFSGTDFEAREVQIAFEKNQPKQAMDILRGIPDNEKALQIAAHQTWKNGQWALAKQTIDDTNAQQNKDGKTIDASQKLKARLAAALSVPSPHLIASNRAKNAGDFQALQTFLDHDIETIKEYVNDE